MAHPELHPPVFGAFENTQQCLDEVEACAVACRVQFGDRSYQADFAENYRDLFTSTSRLYLSEVMDSCINIEERMYVNGTAYSISDSTLLDAASLQSTLGSILQLTQTGASMEEMKTALETFDAAWVYFEKSYILELMRIEAEVREPIITAIALERELTSLESRDADHKGHSWGSAPKLATTLHRESSHSREAEASATHGPIGAETSASYLPTGAESPCRRLRQLSSAGSPRSKQRQESTSSLGFGGASSLGFQRQRQSSGAHGSGGASLDGQRAAEPVRSNIRWLAFSASSTSLLTRGRRETLEKLVKHIAQLNALANIQGHGRDDMTIHVLEAAADVFLACEEAVGAAASDATRLQRASSAAHRVLALRVLESFAELRCYFGEISDNIMKVDPTLSNNSGLVQRLAAWEEAWELGSQFLLDRDFLVALCGVAARLCTEAQGSVPELQSLLENQDAELFLVLPRLALLWGMAEPGLSCFIESETPRRH